MGEGGQHLTSRCTGASRTRRGGRAARDSRPDNPGGDAGTGVSGEKSSVHRHHRRYRVATADNDKELVPIFTHDQGAGAGSGTGTSHVPAARRTRSTLHVPTPPVSLTSPGDDPICTTVAAREKDRKAYALDFPARPVSVAAGAAALHRRPAAGGSDPGPDSHGLSHRQSTGASAAREPDVPAVT